MSAWTRASMGTTLHLMESARSPRIRSSIAAGLLLCTASLACLSRPVAEAESSGLADMLELWLVSEQGVASRFDRIPSMPGLDLPWRIPSVRRFEVFDSRRTLLLGLSHPRSTPELENEPADAARRAAQQAESRASSSEYGSLYDLNDGRFEREIAPAEVLSVQARHVELVDIAPLHAGAVALCTAFTAADLSPGGTVGLCVALLDGQWRTVWQVWIPARWEGRPGPDAATLDGRDSVVRTVRAAATRGADFQLQYEAAGEWVQYVVELAAGPGGAVQVREYRE